MVRAAKARLARLRRPLAIPRAVVAVLRGGGADRLVIAPPDIRTADPIAADHIYAGHYSLAGKAVSTHGHSPFEIAPPSAAWSEALHGFGWLRHLRAADTALARANARALVDDWITIEARGLSMDRRTMRDPRVVSRRLISWLSQSPLILAGADHAFYRRFLGAVHSHCAALRAALGEGLQGEDRLTAAVALVHAGLCLEAGGGMLRRASQALSQELSTQILGDGGHQSRNPRVLVDLLLDLLPARQAFVARGIVAPEAILNAIDRMTPMLRMFRHPDGSLAGFNGMGATEPDTLATLLAHGDVGAAAILEAPYSCYQRLEAGGAVAIADVGAPPPWAYSGEAHAGCLSFEFSSGDDRLVINCGAPRAQAGAVRDSARATAAHSTLILDDHSSSRFEPTGSRSIAAGLLLEGPRRVESLRRTEDDGATFLEAVHDGYARRYSVLHRRALRLAADGASLLGEDRLAPALAPRSRSRGIDLRSAGKAVLRFHLHPSVRAEAEGRSILLAPPSGASWRFEAEGRAVALEESIFFAAAGGPRPTSQIVVEGGAGEAERFGWSFRRLRTAPGAAGRTSGDPPQVGEA